MARTELEDSGEEGDTGDSNFLLVEGIGDVDVVSNSFAHFGIVRAALEQLSTLRELHRNTRGACPHQELHWDTTGTFPTGTCHQ